MKKYFKYILAVAAAAFAVAACNKVEEYQPGEPDVEGCYGVYFPSQEASGSHIYSPEMATEVDITVKRANSKGAIEVPFEIEDPNKAFQFGKIAFADGQSETLLHVTFDNAELGSNASFSVTITDPQYASKYADGAISFDFGFNRVQIYKFFGSKASEDAAEGTISMLWYSEPIDVELYYYATAYENIRYCYLQEVGEDEPLYEFYWNTKTNNITVPQQKINETASGDVCVGDAAAFYNSYYAYGYNCPSQEYFDWSVSFISRNDFFQPYYDGNGGFYLADWLYLVDGGAATGRGYQFGGDSELDAELFIAPGFTRVDYSLDMEADYTVDGVLPLYFETGADIATIKVAGFEGELSAKAVSTAIEAIIDGSEKSQEISTEKFEETETGTLAGEASLKLPSTGTYTIVAVGLDAEGKAQNDMSIVAEYVASADAKDNAVDIKVGTEKISPRYEGTGDDASNAFGYYIVGNDVIAANYAIVKTDSYKKSAAEINALVKSGDEEEGVVVLSDDELEIVNANGGLSELATGLAANTSYTVVVWATNGYLDTIATAEYTTDGLPNEVVKEGTAYAYTIVLNQLFYGSKDVCYDEDLNLEYNPNTKNFEVPHWGNDVTFKFTEKDGVVSVPIQSVGVSMSDYGTFYVMDVTRCDEVFGDGAAEYFGYDATKKGSVDKDGNYVFEVMYWSSEGYAFGAGAEILYLDGVPAAKSAAKAASFDKAAAKKSQRAVSSKWTSPFVSFGRKPCERDAKAVNISVVSVSSARQAKAEASITALTRKDVVR